MVVFMTESQEKIIEILRILNEKDKAVGAKVIADDLNKKGYNLGERAVRYHMKILDEKGFTERVGYSGRKITSLGQAELEKGLIYDQVDFIYSKFEEMIYETNLNLKAATGDIIVNTSKINLETNEYNKLKKSLKEVFHLGLAVSPFINIKKTENKELFIKTVCGTTIDGVLLSHGIPSIPLYGGLLEVKKNIPQRFTELISYKKTSIPPLDAFIADGMTSVMKVAKKGSGILPANFRVIPSDSIDKTRKILNNLSRIGINGILSIGEKGENILGIPVNEGMIGIAIIGGVTPLCAARELGYDIDIKLSEKIAKFEKLTSLISQKNRVKSYKNKILSPKKYLSKQKVPFLLSKAWNLIEKVKYDIETNTGTLIVNVSYLKKSNLDEAIEIMNQTYKSLKNHINPYYKIIGPQSKNSNEVGIATICSLSIDGILINNGIMSTPKYGGLLELGNNTLFTELISYNGASIDPHEIYIFKNMTSITKSGNTPQDSMNILASIKEVPLIARDQTKEILSKIKPIGFPIYKIGKPREIIYNAKLDSYNFGIISGSGLNPIAAINEKRINVKVKAVQEIMNIDDMETLN